MAKHKVRGEKVAIDSIKPHPQNPRIGDIASIAESLEVNGQYSPIVIWNDTIIAGTHTWKACKSLGWKEVAVTRYEGTEDEALRILITDNRTSDLAMYDNEALLGLLKDLPELSGTGWSKAELADLEIEHELYGDGVTDTKDKQLEDQTDPEATTTVVIRLGEFYGELDGEIYNIWLDSMKDAVGDKKSAINKEIKNRLDIPTVPKKSAPKTKTKEDVPTKAPQHFTMEEIELVQISTLKRYPRNAREGDIGAISESLRTLGQYRPVVVNKRNNEILKGNHTVAGASALGWSEIAVAWVDVDDEQAMKIVLADNKTADKATYDNDLLIDVLKGLSTLEGTGFDSEDFIDVVKGSDTTPNEGKVKFKIDKHGFQIPKAVYDEWREDTELPIDAMNRLGIPLSALTERTNDD